MPHLIVQLFVKLSQLSLTLVLLYVREANPGHVGCGSRLLVDDVVQSQHLGIGLLLVELLLHRHALSW